MVIVYLVILSRGGESFIFNKKTEEHSMLLALGFALHRNQPSGSP